MSRAAPALASLVLLACGAAGRAAPGATEIGVAVRFHARPERDAAGMAAAGIRWVRADLAWSHVERERGRYDFSTWDRLLEGIEPHGIRALFILGYGNEIYDDAFPPADEAGRAAFASFAGAAARHFAGRAAWEIWNEPNVPRFWAGSPDAEEYVALARAAAVAIRREDPNAWIAGPALGGETFDRRYLEAAFQAGLLRVVDAVSIHAYAAAHPEAARPLFEETRALIARFSPGRDVPLVVTEWGYPAAQVGRAGQADYLVRTLAVSREAGIPLVIWYDWREPVTPWDSFGLLDARGRPKEAYEALMSLPPARR